MFGNIWWIEVHSANNSLLIVNNILSFCKAQPVQHRFKQPRFTLQSFYAKLLTLTGVLLISVSNFKKHKKYFRFNRV